MVSETEITEGNKILETYYLGYEHDKSSARFHADWSFLMPVVEKLESQGHAVKIEGLSCCIQTGYTLPRPKGICYTGDITTTKIECVWRCAVRFVKTYKVARFEDIYH